MMGPFVFAGRAGPIDDNRFDRFLTQFAGNVVHPLRELP
jgi:hypothetical protein